MRHLEKRREQARQLRGELQERREELHGQLRERRQEQEETPAQTQLRRARAVYGQLTEQLARVSGLLAESGKAAPSAAVMQRELDILLQTVLLRTAVGDSDFSRTEREFIRELAQTGDVVDWVNSAYPEQREPLTWGKLFYLEEDELNTLMDFLTRESRGRMEAVFAPLAEAEALTGKPCRDMFLQEVEAICNAFIAVDGQVEQEEKDAMHRAVQQYVERPIRDAERDCPAGGH